MYSEIRKLSVYYRIPYTSGVFSCKYKQKGWKYQRWFGLSSVIYHNGYVECKWPKGHTDYDIKLEIKGREYFTDAARAFSKALHPPSGTLYSTTIIQIEFRWHILENTIISKYFCFRSIIFQDVSFHQGDECETTGGGIGDAAGKPCIFPFTFKMIKYMECTKFENNGVYWCSTEVDTKGNYVDGEWGNCNAVCPIVGPGNFVIHTR